LFTRRFGNSLRCTASCSQFSSDCCRDETTTTATTNVYQAGWSQNTAIAPSATAHASTMYAVL
jgi:hypothetical protein